MIIVIHHDHLRTILVRRKHQQHAPGPPSKVVFYPISSLPLLRRRSSGQDQERSSRSSSFRVPLRSRPPTDRGGSQQEGAVFRWIASRGNCCDRRPHPAVPLWPVSRQYRPPIPRRRGLVRSRSTTGGLSTRHPRHRRRTETTSGTRGITQTRFFAGNTGGADSSGGDDRGDL